MAAAALCIEWGDGGKLNGGNVVKRVCDEGGVLNTGCDKERAEWYVGSWLGGFEWALFVGVDACA